MKKVIYICDMCGCQIKLGEINEIHIVNEHKLSNNYINEDIEFHGHICNSCGKKIMKERIK